MLKVIETEEINIGRLFHRIFTIGGISNEGSRAPLAPLDTRMAPGLFSLVQSFSFTLSLQPT